MPSYDPSLFNVDPYYDDFSEDKKFLRLMFRPGYGVQARELTQIQTLLQNQVERLGSHIFEEGSIVLDGQISENRAKYVKVSLGSSVGYSDFIGTVIGSSGKASARVVHAEGVYPNSSEANTSVLFFEYTEGGATFAINDLLSATAANGTGITASVTGPNGYVLGDALVASVDRGVRFVEGYFVLNDAQSIGAYTLTGSAGNQIRNYNNSTTRIGFDVGKSFVTSTDDTSLNDPAFGFYNYAAPGSDRFMIELIASQKGFTASDTTAVDNFSRVGFIEFMRVVDGDIVKVEKYPDYAMLEDTLARRTYDESGNYTVTPFELVLKGPTAVGGTSVLKAELSPGKAYVFGYEFETQGKTKVNIPCARGASHERTITRDFNRSIGPYTKVVFSGIPDSFGTTADLATHPLVTLSSGASGAACAAIGTARIRGVEPYTTSVYNLSIYDISLTGGAFSDVTRVFMNGKVSTTSHLFAITGGSATLEGQSQGSLLYPIPEGSGVTAFTNGDYAIVSYAKKTANGSTYTFTVDSYDPVGMEFPLPAESTFSLPNADILVFDQDGKILQGTAERGAAANQLSVTVTGTANGAKLNVIATQEFADSSTSMINFRRTKTLSTISESLTGAFGRDLTGDGRGSTADTLYLNGYTDVDQLLSLTGSMGASSGISLLPYFNFDTGQRDGHYDWSRVTLIPGTVGVTGPYSATFKHYAHNAGGLGPYTAQSYPDYENIPTYTSRTNALQYNLRDCIDFRPDRSLTGDIIPITWVPANTAANSTDWTYTHFLPRTDKIALTRDRRFTVISGIPSLDADVPADDPNAMSLYSVRVNPYTVNSNDASIRYVENKRYTMRDIGALEKRIEAVEYYTTLNLLEQEAKAKSIRDIDDVEMPKRGILVDQFKGHAVADNTDPMFAASVDYENNELRPSFVSRSYGLTGGTVSNVIGTASTGIYTLDYTLSPEISNILASGSVTVNPFNVINYLGTLSISPSTDNWYDSEKQPKVLVNVDGENDNWEQNLSYGFGTRFNDWESIWFGKENQTSKNTRPNLLNPNKLLTAKVEGTSLNNLSASIAPESMKKIINNKTVAKDILPIAREKVITINANGLKPNTTFHVFCDDVNVTPYCTGGSQITDSKGQVSTQYSFNLVNPSFVEQNFSVGRHVIRITDSTDIENPSTWTMSAEAVYAVEGNYNSIAEDGHMSTRLSETRRKSVKSSRVISNLSEVLTSSGEIRGYTEPLAQTFYIDPTKYPKGIFLKSIDLYFSGKETLTTIPITVQVRPTISGYPHPSKVLPFASATKYSDEVNTADLITAGDVAQTNFAFSNPVYLLPGQEYAISILTNSSEYSVFTGAVGSTVLIASEENSKYNITKQPMMRSIFKAQNTGKMVKSDNETLAFRLNLCKFNSSGSVEFVNQAISGDSVFNINEFRLNAVDIVPEGSVITYSSSIAANPSAVPYSQLSKNKNIVPSNGYHPITTGTSQAGLASVTVAMSSSSDGYVSPVFDKEKSSIVAISNIINNNTNTTQGEAQYNGELEPSNVASTFKASARYISKKVTLEEGIEAENITVSMSLCNPKKSSDSPSSVKVFVRPIPVGEVDYDYIDYVELTTTDGGISSSDTDFREVSFTNIGYTTLTKFKSFSIKVVMFGSSTGAAVPRIKNLRMIAT
jgi:hypothetical protein